MPLELQIAILLLLIGALGWFIRRTFNGIEARRRDDTQLFIETTQRLTVAIDKLDTTIDAHNTTLNDFKTHTEARLAVVEQTAIRSERQGKENETDIVEIRGRVGIIEEKCKIHHK
jgi:hypothetical protein